ncbi:MAG TPA: alkaline phosphatase family protein [Candidatus Sulfomarinibacteraceae bacterium]|nr:alkaline phosphatase family protein [Candidatus Sulfomarinibacteraceae bacterium]
MQQTTDPHKLVVIGLDGAPFPLIQQWCREGRLPNLAALAGRGSQGILRSTMPVHSPTAWASFITGLNPGKHGVFDFVQREPDSYQLRVVRSDHISGASLWRLLNEAGHRVGVMNVPMTYPPEEVNGFLLSGLGTPDYVNYSYPPELSEQLTEAGYRVNNKFFFAPDRQDEWLDDIFAMTKQRGETAVRLMEEKAWDFFMVVFRNTDEICHFYWHHMDEEHPQHDPDAPRRYRRAILDLYQLADRWVGRIVEAAGPEANVVVMSDHGAGPLYQDVFLNEWLWQKGYLKLKKEVEDGSLLGQAARTVGLTRENISTALTRLHLHRLEVLIKDVLGDRIYVLPRDKRPEFVNAIDWSRTRAYSFGYYGQVYINIKGREPQGVVEPKGEYEQLRREIADGMSTIIDPRDGQPVVDQVYFKEELYEGPHLGRAPDLLAIMRGFSYMTRKGYEFAESRGTLFRDPYTAETGSHRLEGTLIAAGPDIRPGQQLTENAIYDLTPTLLHLMGCPLPAYMDGSLISDMLAPEFLAERAVQRTEVELPPPRQPFAGWDADREAEIVDRLKKLGYLG